MDRPDVLKRIGELFELRMNVNLVSNVLDTPELFWSEPQLQGTPPSAPLTISRVG